MARPKKAKTELASLEECNRALAEVRAAAAELRVLTGERDLAVARASAMFEPRIDEAKARANEATAALEAYYYGHLAELEAGGAKHVQLSNGRFGRRDNPPALQPLNRSWKWKAIKAAVKAQFGMLYFHPVPEPEIDKDRLKDAKFAVETLRQMGLKVEAGETFYVEPALPAPGEVA